MKNLKIKYLVDVGLLVSFLLVAITGIIKTKLVMGYFELTYMSPAIQKISPIHDLSGVIFVIFALLHLASNYKWYIAASKKIFGKSAD